MICSCGKHPHEDWCVSKEHWQRHEGVTVVECPACAFCMDETHVDADTLDYTCPACAQHPDTVGMFMEFLLEFDWAKYGVEIVRAQDRGEQLALHTDGSAVSESEKR